MSNSGLTAEEFSAWLTPRQALRVVQQGLPDIGIASRTIMEHLRGDQVAAAAKSSDAESKAGIVFIPAFHWNAVSGNKPDWWDTGVLRVFLKERGTIRYFGVRFDPSDVDAIIADLPKRAPPKTVAVVAGMSATAGTQPPPAPAQSVVIASTEVKSSPVASNVGRPPKPYWPELWIEMCRQIYTGQLDSSNISVSKIADAMMDWSSLKYPDDVLSESAAKRAARRLADALKGSS